MPRLAPPQVRGAQHRRPSIGCGSARRRGPARRSPGPRSLQPLERLDVHQPVSGHHPLGLGNGPSVTTGAPPPSQTTTWPIRVRPVPGRRPLTALGEFRVQRLFELYVGLDVPRAPLRIRAQPDSRALVPQQHESHRAILPAAAPQRTAHPDVTPANDSRHRLAEFRIRCVLIGLPGFPDDHISRGGDSEVFRLARTSPTMLSL